MKTIESLFGGEKPFIAGFGNRDTDSQTYMSLGIDKKNIFVIDENEKVVQVSNPSAIIKGYTQILKQIDIFFPIPSTTDFMF